MVAVTVASIIVIIIIIVSGNITSSLKKNATASKIGPFKFYWASLLVEGSCTFSTRVAELTAQLGQRTCLWT